MSRGPDAATLLTRALAADAERSGCPIRLAAWDWTRWASATFIGARHTLTVEAPPSELFDRWLAALPDAEIALRGHLLADIVVMAVRRDGAMVTADLEALTVEQ